MKENFQMDLKSTLKLDFTVTLNCPKCGYIVMKYPSYYKKFILSCGCGDEVIKDYTDIYKKFDYNKGE